MKLEHVPIGAVDWSQVPVVAHDGETGTATARTYDLGAVKLRLVDYAPAIAPTTGAPRATSSTWSPATS